MLDLNAENQALLLPKLIRIHEAKTGALITASVLSGALASRRTCIEEEVALKTFGQEIGLAFQIHDDVLDAEGDIRVMGKTPRQDCQKNKSTFVTQLGLEEAKRQAQEHYTKAIEALGLFGEKAKNLRELSAYIIQRAQ